MTMIYQPKGKALEYAELATNPYRGCGHACAYCYVPLITKQKRPEFNAGAVPRADYLAKLRRSAAKFKGTHQQVLLSFTTDPYHPGDTTLTRQTLEVLIEHNIPFCTLTKGGSRALRDIDLFRRDFDAFGTTLTSTRDETKKWEPNAASSQDRMDALEEFHDMGIFTWVSLEPTLSEECSFDVINRTHEYVDLYKVGRANYVGKSLDIDWERYTLACLDLLSKLGKRHYVKADLQKYLPFGYNNPVRVPQNHANAST
jgi:DNA repair photolyase